MIGSEPPNVDIFSFPSRSSLHTFSLSLSLSLSIGRNEAKRRLGFLFSPFTVDSNQNQWLTRVGFMSYKWAALLGSKSSSM
jgi:hypothetical protein